MKRIRKKSHQAPFVLNLRQPAKKTALLALKNALLQERYEICSKIIAVAREHGTQDREIQYFLEDPKRSPD